MRVHLAAQGFELTEALKSHTQERFNRLDVFPDARKNEVHVVLHAAHGVEPSRAEAKLHAMHGEVFVQAKHADLYQAISECAHKIHAQLAKKHERQSEHRSDVKRSTI